MSYMGALARRRRTSALLGVHGINRACCYLECGREVELGPQIPREQEAGAVARSLRGFRSNEWTEAVVSARMTTEVNVRERG
jgi:hypothetical protein